MQKLLPLLLGLALTFLFSNSIFAQNPGRVSIKGVVLDTLGEPAGFATVMLLTPKDSTLVNFTRAGEKGDFSFKNVKNTPYLLKVSYVGHLPLQQYLPASATETNDVGTLRIKPITSELLEVVVRAAKATLSIRGDTIEYDASSFKVPPGSTVEDLLRRLPGIDVDADGNIKAQGKDVRRVYVDGKTFFGDDPKAATKNLGAETISKVQVYNESSEQAKLTGVDDGKREKTMNLELKEEYKKGAFGKVTAAVGTEERWAGRGNYNRFNKKEQLSFIGFANNINQTGVNWEDYGEFKGQSTFSGFDNGDFGFGGGSRRYFVIGGEGDDSPFNYFDGRGFTENYGGGANYNFDRKKTKLNASYFYKQTDLDLDQFAERLSFPNTETTVFNTDTTQQDNFRGSHSLNARYEQELDSSNWLVFKAETRLSNSESRNVQSQFFTQNDVPKNTLNLDNQSELSAWRLTTAGIFRHRFKKKGRSFLLSAGYNSSENDGSDALFSRTQFFNATNPNEQIRQIRQQNTRASISHQYKSSALFTESFSKKWFLETFANYSYSDNAVDRQVADPENNGRRIDSLSVYYDQSVRYQRLGSSLRYSHKGLNLSAGLAAQQLHLAGQYSVAKGLPLLADPVSRDFLNWTPNVEAEYQLSDNAWLSGNYAYSVSEPSLNDLQPVPDVSNPTFRSEGNPNLQPSLAHNLGINFNYWNSGSLASIGFGGDYSTYDRQIAYNQTFETTDTSNVFVTRPVNVTGGNTANGYVWSNFPIVKTKLTFNLNPGFNVGNTPIFLDGVQTETFNENYNLRAGLTFTPNSKLIASLSADTRINNIRYKIRPDQDQKIRGYGTNASLKWQFANKTFLESNFDYDVFRNDRFDFDQSVAIWNASLRRLIGKNNRIEARLAAFDLLNQRLTISQSGQPNYVVNSVAPTLARYFMLSLSYNVRGYENKLKKNEWW
jgi:hypothetical protein